MPEQTGLVAVIAAISAALGAALKWVLDLRRDGRDASGAALLLLGDTMKLMRGEIERLSASVNEARDQAAEARRETAESRQVEARCQERVAELCKDLQALRDAIQRANIAVPPLRSVVGVG